MPPEQEFVIALGANLPSIAGTPRQTLIAAVQRLASQGLALRRVSRYFQTPCFPEGAGPDYVNAVVYLTGKYNPEQVLGVLHAVETEFARDREKRWASRTLDLDLLASGDMVRPDDAGFRDWQSLPPETQVLRAPDALVLPHPRLAERGFVLVPMADIVPDWRHPVLGRTVRQMLDALPEPALRGIVAL